MTATQMKETRDALKFTRLCKYWSANRCNLGADCNFAHSEHELRNQPDLVSTRLCFQFARKGVCKNGEACTFAHGKTELRRLPKTGKNAKNGGAGRSQELVNAQPPAASVPPQLKTATPDFQMQPKMMNLQDGAPRKIAIPLSGLSLDASLIRPPPGLESPGELSPARLPLPGLSLFDDFAPSKEEFRFRLPLDIPKRVVSAPETDPKAEMGTESASTVFSGSDVSEPASPTSDTFWL
mmetsp:Transcript_32384/g.60968  ORF Transcript_32384/g.60968 Transcript_32384/m.60968 type:complete len:238 (+) Transcript_32384:67-780(+)